MSDEPKKEGAAGKAIDKVADTAHEVINTAAEAAKKMAEVKEKPEWMIAHEAADAEHFRKINEILSTLPTKDDLKGLATDKSVRDVVHWQKNIVATATVVSVGQQRRQTEKLVVPTAEAALVDGVWAVVHRPAALALLVPSSCMNTSSVGDTTLL